jgi:hypothetical protein
MGAWGQPHCLVVAFPGERVLLQIGLVVQHEPLESPVIIRDLMIFPLGLRVDLDLLRHVLDDLVTQGASSQWVAEFQGARLQRWRWDVLVMSFHDRVQARAKA